MRLFRRAAQHRIRPRRLERRTFDWFWDLANPVNGLVPDRWPSKSFSSIAAVGFGLTAFPIGVERGWISRAQARTRTLATLRFFADAPQGPEATGVTGYKGFFYHFVDMENGRRFETTELSSIDTTLLLGGMLFAAEYFSEANPDETEIRRLANLINDRVDWPWMLGKGPYVSMGWTPEKGFIPAQWDRYNEATLLYLLALGSPTHPIAPEIWTRYTAEFDKSWGMHWGQQHMHFPPMFGHQYSHVWVDFKGIADPWLRAKRIDLFENSRRATHAQRNYAIANPGGWTGYSGDMWGLTACDGPGDFKRVYRRQGTRVFQLFGARPQRPRRRHPRADRGGGSIAFAPDIVMPGAGRDEGALRRRNLRPLRFLRLVQPNACRSRSGRKAAPRTGHPGRRWVDSDYLGIDQGPIVTMIANHRNGLVWKAMRKSRPVVAGLRKAGFSGGWLG